MYLQLTRDKRSKRTWKTSLVCVIRSYLRRSCCSLLRQRFPAAVISFRVSAVIFTMGVIARKPSDAFAIVGVHLHPRLRIARVPKCRNERCAGTIGSRGGNSLSVPVSFAPPACLPSLSQLRNARDFVAAIQSGFPFPHSVVVPRKRSDDGAGPLLGNTF